ncbi:hypothetical protein PG987_007314 [Apiospora arundinis]
MGESSRQDYLHSRPRHPPDEAVRFIENRIAPASDVNPVYHEGLNDFVLVEEAENQNRISADMWKEADKEKEQLFCMMEKVREKLAKGAAPGDVQSLAKVDLRKCKWEEVMNEVQTTSTQWRKSAIKSTKTMQCIDKVGQNCEAFQSWLELLPAGDYGSSIAGVFKVVIGAAGRYNKVEEAIFESLSEIPEIMESARRYVQIYYENRDQRLEQKTFELFRAILRALIQIMEFFADSRKRKVFQPLLHQGEYKRKLTDSIDEIKKHTERIKEEANICLAERSRNHERTSQLTNQNSEKQLQYQESTIDIVRDLHRMFKESPLMILKHKNELLQPNAAFLIDRDMMTAFGISLQSPMQSSPADTEALRSKLREAIRYDPEVLVSDIQATIRSGLALGDQPKAVAASLATHPGFADYFLSTGSSADGEARPTSSALLVNGRMDPTSSDGVSPLGLVVAEVARSSTGRRGAYVISYFCDQHRPGYIPSSAASSSETSRVDPVGAIVASFIGQLLAQMQEQQVKPDFSFLKDEDWPRLHQGRLNTLCIAFGTLVGQLPSESVLLCMIDGATQYETAALGTDMMKLIRRLVRLVHRSNQEDEEQRLVCKLLVTCRTRARGIAQYFDHGRDRDGSGILNLDGDTEATDSSNRRIASLRDAH